MKCCGIFIWADSSGETCRKGSLTSLFLPKNRSQNFLWESCPTCIGREEHSFFFFFFNIFKFTYLFFREGERRERGRKTVIGCFSHAPNWGLGLQPRHVPWPRIEPATFWSAGRHSICWGIPARVRRTFLSSEGSECQNTSVQTKLWEQPVFSVSLLHIFPSPFLTIYGFLNS